MLPHEREFDLIQACGLGEDFRRNGDLADIVDARRNAEPTRQVVLESEFAGDRTT